MLCKDCFYWTSVAKSNDFVLIGETVYKKSSSGEEKTILVGNKLIVVKIRSVGKVPNKFLDKFINKAEFI